jgi:hypothetical protein
MLALLKVKSNKRVQRYKEPFIILGTGAAIW